MMGKAEGAFLTIGELAADLDVPQHILRYWETRFPELRPLQRAGNRRYYRPADVALARRINRLLNQEGYTIKGVQKLLAAGGAAEAPVAAPAPPPAARPSIPPRDFILALRAIRDDLAEALRADGRRSA